jgi:hypothetical protein
MNIPDLSRLKAPAPDFTPYPDELQKIAIVMAKLSNAFDFTNFNETNKSVFEIAAHEEFATIGIEIRVNWSQIHQKHVLVDEVPTGVWLPGIEPIGRTRKESETDHDRITHGVVKGLLDGQPGYLREDGTRHEEPRKKTIQ